MKKITYPTVEAIISSTLTASEKTDPAPIAKQIDSGENVNMQVEEGSEFARSLARELEKLGWKQEYDWDKSSVASFQANLVKAGRVCEIIASSFLGVFTDIRVWKHTRPEPVSSEMIKRKDGTTSPRGLWDNIRDKKKRGEKPRKPGSPGAPTKEAFKKSQK